MANITITCLLHVFNSSHARPRPSDSSAYQMSLSSIQGNGLSAKRNGLSIYLTEERKMEGKTSIKLAI